MSNQLFVRVAAFIALFVAGLAVSEHDPLKPEDAFRYQLKDLGEVIAINWMIEDGYYLYKNKLDFESDTPDITIRKIHLPDGLIHEDEFFGEQEIYRGNFTVLASYAVRGKRPSSFRLVVKSQGCADFGLCYPPQESARHVDLRDSSSNSIQALGDIPESKPLSPDDFPPPDEVFLPAVLPVDGNTVELVIRIEPGFYLYRDKLSVTALGDDARAGEPELPAGRMKTDEFFGEQEVYYDEVVARVPITRATPEAMTLDLEIGYQGCADGGLCYLPQTKTVTVELPEATSVIDLPAATSGNPAPVSEQARLATIITESSLWAAAGVFFLAGLGLAFTPCVLPMVPILSGIIAGEGDDVSPARGFGLAFSYVMGMALVYTAAGVAAAAAGMQLQATFNQPWVLILFSTLFVVLSLGMFGAYDLQMPSGIQSRLASVSGNQKSGTTVGAFVMGAISALVVTACVAPALIAALTVMAQTGDMLRGGTALFAMSLGMGAPLLAVGAAQGQLLPKAGPWMVAIKVAFGFMFLGLAVWMLSRILPGSVTMTLWAALIFMAGVFMGGLTTLTPESGVAQKLGKGFGLLAILYGLVLFLGALTGGTNPLKPLASVSFAGGGIAAAKQEHLEFTRIKTVDDFERELSRANAAGHSVMLDFYADWCVSCIEMEEYTFSEPGVRAALADAVLLQADVTKADKDDRALLKRFGSFGPPTILFFTADGEWRQAYDVVGFMPAGEFAAHASNALNPSR